MSVNSVNYKKAEDYIEEVGENVSLAIGSMYGFLALKDTGFDSGLRKEYLELLLLLEEVEEKFNDLK